MSFTIRKFHDQPIILGKTLDSFDLTIDLYPCLYAACAQLETAEKPCYLLGDIRKLKLSLGDILNGYAIASQGNAAIIQHPNLIELVLISESSLLTTSLPQIRNPNGKLARVSVQPTLEAGLAYVRSLIEKAQKPPSNGYRKIGTGRLDTPSGQSL